MNKPTNRREIFMNAIATGCECPIEPVTREEMFLAEHAKREAAGGGASSWNDLTDKPFGDAFNDMIFIEVDAEAWGSKMVGPGQMGYQAIVNPVMSDAEEFEYGKTYEVRLNDEYFGKWVCDGSPYFAERIKLTNAEGKSYEVMICTENTTGGRYIMLDDDAVEIANWPKAVFRIGVAGVKTLDPKYLPKVSALDETWIAELKTALGI